MPPERLKSVCHTLHQLKVTAGREERTWGGWCTACHLWCLSGVGIHLGQNCRQRLLSGKRKVSPSGNQRQKVSSDGLHWEVISADQNAVHISGSWLRCRDTFGHREENKTCPQTNSSAIHWCQNTSADINCRQVQQTIQIRHNWWKSTNKIWSFGILNFETRLRGLSEIHEWITSASRRASRCFNM